MIIADYDEQHAPRGPHGVLTSDATDPANHPYDPNSTGRFVWEPVTDFAQDALERAKKARREAAGEEDMALLWRVKHVKKGSPET